MNTYDGTYDSAFDESSLFKALKHMAGRLRELDPNGADRWINKYLTQYQLDSDALDTPLDYITESNQLVSPHLLQQASRSSVIGNTIGDEDAPTRGDGDESAPINDLAPENEGTSLAPLAENPVAPVSDGVDPQVLGTEDVTKTLDSDAESEFDEPLPSPSSGGKSGSSRFGSKYIPGSSPGIGVENPIQVPSDDESTFGDDNGDDDDNDAEYEDDSGDKEIPPIEEQFTPPSSPPTTFARSAAESTRSSARTPLPSSSAANHPKVTPTKKRARDDDEVLPPAKKSKKPQTSASASASTSTEPKKRREGWSEEEQQTLHKLLVERRDLEAKHPAVPKAFDNNLWTLMSARLNHIHGIDRAPNACKNQWGRVGRAKFGFDERSKLKRSSGLATSVQTTKTKGKSEDDEE